MIDAFKRLPYDQGQLNNYTLKYSTPSKFVEAIKKERGQSLPKFKGDFFPYIDEYNLQWTGYFTTRPNFKRMLRDLTERYYAAS